MGLFKGREYKQQAESLSKRVAELEAMLTPEMRDADRLRKEIASLSEEKRQAEQQLASERDAASKEVAEREKLCSELDTQIAQKRDMIVDFDDDLLVQEFGLYKPRFDFQTVDEYKEKLKAVRAQEKTVIKDMNAQAKATQWTVNGSIREGRKMVGQTTRLLTRAFNSECDEYVRKVKFSNIDKTIDSIRKLADTVSKLGSTMGISIPRRYTDLKVEEAQVAYEYAKFKNDEKERARELREKQREEEKLRKEIESKRKELEKERKKNEGELKKIVERLKSAEGEERDGLMEKKAELEGTLGEISKAVEDVDYREANIRAGYVYVISNIGSFGKDVYKIGMTRRLDPMDRVRELGDASVPFNFDVHAMIFTDDAPGLEAALHREFDDRKLNRVNTRREFFKVSLDEIKRVVKENYDKTVEFVEVPDAEQYRVSKKMYEQRFGQDRGF